jgi:hypothetical protein
VRWLLLLLWLLPSIALADPPSGYECGRGGRAIAGKGCRCPAGKIDARDPAGKAICATKPPPDANACLAARRGKHPVRVDSQPPGATLYIGDRSCGAVGTTPWTGTLATGPLRVIAEHQGFDPVERTIEVTGKGRLAIHLQLARTNMGTVAIRADADPNVEGAAVTIDGEPRGSAPITVKLRGGRHQLELAKPGFEPFEQWIDVVDSVTTTVVPVLVPARVETGSLFVDADVPGAEVRLDGAPRGKTPLVIDPLPVGSYAVEVAASGRVTWKQTVQVRRGQVAVKATLAASAPAAATTGMLSITSKIAAEVVLDGEVVGRTPLSRALREGEYWLVVRAEGYKPFDRRVRITAGQTLDVTAALAPVARLAIESSPEGAAVFVDGVRVGITPVVVDVVHGEHAIIVEHRGYQRHTQTVRMDTARTLSVTLKR